VIIGAMLIAMLFGPIIGIAMALAETDVRLLGRTLKAAIVGAICVLAIGCYGLFNVAPHDRQRGAQSNLPPCLLEFPLICIGLSATELLEFFLSDEVRRSARKCGVGCPFGCSLELNHE
jgi:NADH:ubiquinone oxidoreductase subunit 6 (subunit J)